MLKAISFPAIPFFDSSLRKIKRMWRCIVDTTVCEISKINSNMDVITRFRLDILGECIPSIRCLAHKFPLVCIGMIISCEFTNATDFVRERVVFVVGMQLMIDSENRLFSVNWEHDKEDISRLHRAMHDPEFRIHLDRDGLLITMAVRLERWSIFFIAISWRQGDFIYPKLCIIRRAIRRWVMRKRLCIDRVFSKVAAAQRVLKNRLNQDVMHMVVLYCIQQDCQQPYKDNLLEWVKPQRDGYIYD